MKMSIFGLLCSAVVQYYRGVLNTFCLSNSFTCLLSCCRQGHLQMVVLLMQHGADPSLRDGEGEICSFFPTTKAKEKTEFFHF